MSRMPNYSVLGSGPTVLMLHGIGGGHLAFAPQLETLAQAGFRAVSWDMPGYGHSDPIEPYTFKGLAEKCIELIEGLTHTAAKPGLTLVGHSMGGMVAQEVVVRRPDLVHRLVLCGGGVNRANVGVRVGRTQKSQSALRVEHHIVGILAVASQQLFVFQTAHGLTAAKTQVGGVHGGSSLGCRVGAKRAV
jgi:pimeloyl-ACP methyl ester carboxylesterase